MGGGGCTHSMKVTIYAPPFRPLFFRSLENLYSLDPYILAKMRKMSYFDPYILAKMRKMSYFDPYILEKKWGKCCISTPIFHQNWVKCIVLTPFIDPCSVSSRRAVRSTPIRKPDRIHPSTGLEHGPWRSNVGKVMANGHISIQSLHMLYDNNKPIIECSVQ